MKILAGPSSSPARCTSLHAQRFTDFLSKIEQKRSWIAEQSKQKKLLNFQATLSPGGMNLSLCRSFQLKQFFTH